MDRQQPIFREIVTHRLAFPEELTEGVTIIRPCDWMILGTFAMILLAAILWGSIDTIPDTVYGQGIIRYAGTTPVFAPQSGVVRSISVGNGIVDAGTTMVELIPSSLPAAESPRTATIRLAAPFRARVVEVIATPGDRVTTNTPLYVIAPAGQPLQAVLFVQPNLAAGIRPGLKVQLKSGAYAPGKEANPLSGKVSWISSYPSSDSGLRQVLDQEVLVRDCIARGLRLRVDVMLDEYGDHNSGNPPFGASVGGDILVSREHPILWLLRPTQVKGSE